MGIRDKKRHDFLSQVKYCGSDVLQTLHKLRSTCHAKLEMTRLYWAILRQVDSPFVGYRSISPTVHIELTMLRSATFLTKGLPEP